MLELETDKATIEVPSSVGGTGHRSPRQGRRQGEGRPGGARRRRGRGGRPRRRQRATRRPRATAQPAAAAASEPAAAPPKPRPRPRARRRSPSRSRPRSPRRTVVDISTSRAAGRGRRATHDRAAPVAGESPVPAAPSVRRYARELGVDIARGRRHRARRPHRPGGREAACEERAGGRRPGAGAGARRPLPDFSKWGEVEVKPMSNIRRKTAEHLTVAWQAPHVTQHDKADITGARGVPQGLRPRVEKAGGKLTVTAIAHQGRRAGASNASRSSRRRSTWRTTHRLQEIPPHRRRRRYAERPARAGDPRRGPQDDHRDRRRARRRCRRRRATRSSARRDVGRRLHDQQSRRHRRHVVHADHQPAGGRDSRRVAHGAIEPVWQGRTSSCRARCCRCRCRTTIA